MLLNIPRSLGDEAQSPLPGTLGPEWLLGRACHLGLPALPREPSTSSDDFRFPGLEGAVQSPSTRLSTRAVLKTQDEGPLLQEASSSFSVTGHPCFTLSVGPFRAPTPAPQCTLGTQRAQGSAELSPSVPAEPCGTEVLKASIRGHTVGTPLMLQAGDGKVLRAGCFLGGPETRGLSIRLSPSPGHSRGGIRLAK